MSRRATHRSTLLLAFALINASEANFFYFFCFTPYHRTMPKKKAYQILRAKAAEKARLKKASSDTSCPLAHVLHSPPQPPTLPTPPTHASPPHSSSSTSTTAPVEPSGEPHPPAQVAIEPQAGPSGEPHPLMTQWTRC